MATFLTLNQQMVLDFIEAYIEVHHFSPTQVEIGDGMKMSRTLVKDYLFKLEKKGWIITPGRKYRNIKLRKGIKYV